MGHMSSWQSCISSSGWNLPYNNLLYYICFIINLIIKQSHLILVVFCIHALFFL